MLRKFLSIAPNPVGISENPFSEPMYGIQRISLENYPVIKGMRCLLFRPKNFNNAYLVDSGHIKFLNSMFGLFLFIEYSIALNNCNRH